LLLWGTVLAIGVLVVGHQLPNLADPFGPSHDGFNAALYMTGGRAIVEDGLVLTRVGARSRVAGGEWVVYAHHPPLVYALAALAAASGTSEVSARLSAALASLAAVVLLGLLLTACGLPPGAAGLGLLYATATPMFLAFGTMLEPHVLGLAPMVLLVSLWQRMRVGDEPPAMAWILGAGVATLTSWLGGLLCLWVGGTLLLSRRRRPAVALLAATVGSAILIGGWMWWAYEGALGEFVQRALHRTGTVEEGRVTVIGMARQQARYLTDLFPVGGWLAVPAAGLGLLDRRTRPIVGASLGAVLGYALIFRNGASDHNYWLYCLILPLALGAAVGADAVARWSRSHVARPGLVRAALAAALVGALGITTLLRPSMDESQRRYAATLGADARSVRWPQAQRYAYHTFGERGPTDLLPWLLFYSRRQPFGVDGPQSVPPDELLLRMVDGRLVAVPGAQVSDP
jgi:hypothetical protein